MLLIFTKYVKCIRYQCGWMNMQSFFLGLCKIFEEHLKRMNPGRPQITYDIAQLFDFIDELTDLCCLV